MSTSKQILNLISQTGSLMNMKRSHHRHFGESFDTIASHSFQTSVIAYIVCRMENLSNKDAMKTTTMAIFHDISEARTGDFGYIEKHYATIDEEKAVNTQYRSLDFGNDLKELFDEYEARESIIAKCVKDADSLSQMYVEWMLMYQGNKLAERWFLSDFNDRVPALKTESAKKIAYQMKESTPQDWWWDEFLTDEAANDMSLLLGKKK